MVTRVMWIAATFFLSFGTALDKGRATGCEVAGFMLVVWTGAELGVGILRYLTEVKQ